MTEYEFLKYALVRAELIDEALLSHLHDRFCGLDEDGSGVLTWEDLPRQEPCEPKSPSL